MAEELEIFRRLNSGQSIKAIHRETGYHKTTIRKLKQRAENVGLLSGKQITDTEFAELLKEAVAPERAHPLDAYRDDFQRWVNEGISFVVMHKLLREKYACDESTLRRYVQRKFPTQVKPVIRRDTKPGEIMEVDFGYLGIFFDLSENRNRKVWCFSARLNHSRKAYRQICLNQSSETFLECHIRAFEHFGGVPEKVVPDNLKAAVIKASFHEPLLNRAYRSLAEHYGFFINPCLPYTPQHKGGVESDIKYVKNNFLPLFKETQRKSGRDNPHISDLTAALEEWDRNTADVRKIRGVGRSPAFLFESEEKSALKSLPTFRWEPVTFALCKVAPDFRVQFKKAYYSVPYRFIGKQVLVRSDLHSVQIYLENRLISEHARAQRTWQVMVKAEHAPQHPSEYLSISRQGLLKQAEYLGAPVRELISKIFEDKSYEGIRPARGVLSFGRKYSVGRLQNACRRALEYNTASYMSVKNILEKGLDKISGTENPRPSFRFAREPGYFDFHREEGETNE
jgi:transposase